MKNLALATLTLISLTACGELSSEKQEKAVAKPGKKTKEVAGDEVAAIPEIPADEIKKPVRKIDFVDPDTTGTLLTDESKKTVSGPAPPPEPGEGDSVINVSPPPLPVPPLPATPE